MQKKIYLVDDHPLVRQGLTQLILEEPDLSVCGDTADSPSALREISQERPDVVIVDLSLKDGDGIELIKSIRTQFPDLAILVLTMHEESFYAERALRAGAQGYLTKQEASENVVQAIRQLLAGDIYVSERLSPKLLKRLIRGTVGDSEPLIARLSDRELQVFILIGDGRSTQQVAEKLHLSVKTIETYRANIKDKLRLKDARDLVQYATRWVLRQNGH